MRTYALTLIAGFALDLLLGDPAWLYHPVRIIGKYIAFVEKKLRARGGNLRTSAILLTASTVIAALAAVALILLLLSRWGRLPLLIGMALLNWMGLAARSMAMEAQGVYDALSDGVEAGRKQVARIVGRDTARLTEEEVVKAAVETVAENTTDGVISPMLYAALGGPVLLWGFKAASTLDSMVGYLDDQYRDIGWSSARLDDILNFIPARLTAILMVCAAWLLRLDAANALRVVRRDHANHRSPNCAWSEAAAAGALHIQLGGTHDYFGKPVEKPTIGDPDRPIDPEDITRTVRLMYAASTAALVLFAAVRLALVLTMCN